MLHIVPDNLPLRYLLLVGFGRGVADVRRLSVLREKNISAGYPLFQNKVLSCIFAMQPEFDGIDTLSVDKLFKRQERNQLVVV